MSKASLPNPSALLSHLIVLGAFTGAFAVTSAADALPKRDDGIDENPYVPTPKMPYADTTNGFTWMAPNRAAMWAGAWRSREDGGGERYDIEYMRPSTWYLWFNGCTSDIEWSLDVERKPTVNTYEWRTSLGYLAKGKDCVLQLPFPAQGTYQVSLIVKSPQGAVLRTQSRTVQVKDRLIAVMGDSFGSGEGVPDSGGAVNGLDATWVDKRCHRSKAAGAARAAQRLEDADPYTSVTFISFACSGATIDRDKSPKDGAGILRPYLGIEPEDHYEKLHSQVAQLAYAVQGERARKIDTLLVIGGINDLQFADMMTTCVLESDCKNAFVPHNGNEYRLETRTNDHIDALRGAYKKIAQALAAQNVTYTQAYNVEYPSAFTTTNGALCSAVLNDVIGPGAAVYLPAAALLAPIDPVFTQAYLAGKIINSKVDTSEISWLQNTVLPKVTEAVKKGAEEAGWGHISGLGARFKGHGYCAGSKSWFQTAITASEHQGPYLAGIEGVGLRMRTQGTIHPNYVGHDEFGKHIFEAIRGQYAVTAPVPKTETYTMDEDTKLVAVPVALGEITMGVLFNDHDPSGAQLYVEGAKASVGALAMAIDGGFSYTPPADFHGEVTLTYNVTNGLRSVPATSKIIVKPVADPVLAVNDVYTMKAGTALNLPVQLNDKNPDKLAVTLTHSLTGRGQGSLAVVMGSYFRYTAPASASPSVVTFNYTLTSPINTSTATVTIQVQPQQSGHTHL